MNSAVLTRRRDPGPVPALRDALASLRSGRTTASALVTQALDRAEGCRKALNAFAAIDWDRALRAAAESDELYAAGRPRSLEGLPIAIKDLIDTRGIETRYGSAAYEGHVPACDADVVRRLTERGAIVIGKTSTHEFAWGVTTASAAYGETLNPLDRTRIPGGSSGGAAAAVGYGAVAAGVGTDTGGSVRIPAALCGVVGFKPTLGALPTRGVFPLAPTLDHVGLLGRRVDDVALLASAFQIDVPDNDAWVSARIGVLREIAPVPLADEVALAFDGAVARLRATFAVATLADGDLFAGVYPAFARLVLTEAGVEHFRLNAWQRITSQYGSETVERLELAKNVTLREYAQAQEARRAFAGRLHAAMADVDYLVLPTCPCIAPRLGESTLTLGSWSGTVREALMTYTAPFNMAGFPAISLPLPGTGSGLPAALQIVAHPGDDGALLQIAQLIEPMLQGENDASN